MRKIAVLMTCYNRVDTSLECLRRLFAQEVPDGYSFDVWLVDDASPDRTGEKVKAAYTQVNVIQGTGKLFWCKGMRLAWEKAAEAHDYDGYLWLNDDVMLLDGALKALTSDISELDASGELEYVVVGACADSEGAGKFTYGCYDNRYAVLAPNGKPRKADASYMMSGNFVYVSRGAFRKIGFISGDYTHAYGDSDYRQTMQERGVPMCCCSVVVGVCRKEPSRYVQLHKASFAERLAALCDPKGRPLRDVFIYRRRHWGLVRALVSVLHVTLLVLFPGGVRK